MRQQNKVRSAETLGAEMGRELTEDELAAICGGRNSGNLDSGDFSNLLGTEDLLGGILPLGAKARPSGKESENNGGLPGLSGLGLPSSLSGLLGGLL